MLAELETVRGSRVSVGCETTVAPSLRDSMAVSWRRGDVTLFLQQGEGNIAILTDNTLGKYGWDNIALFLSMLV
jgi:hypothetical protein